MSVNTLRPRQNGRHFPDDIFKWIFLNENVWISINISLKFVPWGSINNIPALVQAMAWRRQGDKPLSEPMMVRLPTHICVTRPQWVNSLCSRETRYDAKIMVTIYSGNEYLPDGLQAITPTRVDLSSIGLKGTSFSAIWIKYKTFLKKMHWNMQDSTRKLCHMILHKNVSGSHICQFYSSSRGHNEISTLIGIHYVKNLI